jgi:7-carboxy-7-deazaguanine synthase
MSDTLIVNEIYASLQGESSFAGWPCIFVRLTACNLRCSYCDTAYAFTEGRKQTLSEIRAEVHRLASPYRSVADRQSPVAKAQQLPGHDPSIPRDEPQAPPVPAPPTARHPPPTTTTHRLPLVEFTGGEPLLQPNVLPLMKRLCDDGFAVLLETSGALDIAPVDPRVHRIMDLKCPSSGEAERNRWDNLGHLTAADEIKFVIGTVEDYDWARKQITRHRLDTFCPILMSWVMPLQPQQQDPSLKRVPAGQTALTRRELAERILADALPVRLQLQMHKFIWPPDQRSV